MIVIHHITRHTLLLVSAQNVHTSPPSSRSSTHSTSNPRNIYSQMKLLTPTIFPTLLFLSTTHLSHFTNAKSHFTSHSTETHTLHHPKALHPNKKDFLTCEQTYGGASIECGGSDSTYCYNPTIGEVSFTFYFPFELEIPDALGILLPFLLPHTLRCTPSSIMDPEFEMAVGRVIISSSETVLSSVENRFRCRNSLRQGCRKN